MRTTPAVSVVMPVHNGLPHVTAAVESILTQTVRDLELVILDDASTDGSGAVLAGLAASDQRVRVLRNRTRSGAVRSSQRVVEAARAPLVARMDGDDVAHRRRIELQLEALHSRPDAVLVGALWEGIDDVGRVVRPRDRWLLRKPSLRVPFPHGTAMVRRSAFDRVGGYRPGTEGWEDLDLFIRLSELGRVYVLTQPLYRYRFHAQGASGFDTEMRWATMRRQLHPSATSTASGDAVGSPELAALSYMVARDMWGGRRPPLGAIVRRHGARLVRPGAARLALVGAASWCAPSLTRRVLRILVAWRDRLAGLLGVPSDGVWPWSFGPPSGGERSR